MIAIHTTITAIPSGLSDRGFKFRVDTEMTAHGIGHRTRQSFTTGTRKAAEELGQSQENELRDLASAARHFLGAAR